MAELIVMAAIVGTQMIGSAVTSSYEQGQICDLDDQIDDLNNRISKTYNEWANIETDVDVFTEKLQDLATQDLVDYQNQQQKIVNTQKVLKRQRNILLVLAFIIVVVTGLSLSLKLLLKKQQNNTYIGLDLIPKKYKK